MLSRLKSRSAIHTLINLPAKQAVTFGDGRVEIAFRCEENPLAGLVRHERQQRFPAGVDPQHRLSRIVDVKTTAAGPQIQNLPCRVLLQNALDPRYIRDDLVGGRKSCQMRQRICFAQTAGEEDTGFQQIADHQSSLRRSLKPGAKNRLLLRQAEPFQTPDADRLVTGTGDQIPLIGRHRQVRDRAAMITEVPHQLRGLAVRGRQAIHENAVDRASPDRHG